MSGLRVCALVLAAGLAVAGGATSASAQGLSQYGMWGEAPVRNRAAPSMLGAAPPVARTASVALAQGGARPNISARAPKTVAFPNGFTPGSIIIDHTGRKLYYTLSHSAAYVYPVAVGKQGFSWTGVERVSRIEDWPDWYPPAEMRQRQPSLPVRMTGGLRNPLGAKAIYLGSTLYRIHGTNDSRSIGSASSSGCFRMHNDHVVHLANHVDASTVVFVMRRLPKSGPVMPPPGYLPAAKAAPEGADSAGEAEAPAVQGEPPAVVEPEQPAAPEGQGI